MLASPPRQPSVARLSGAPEIKAVAADENRRLRSGINTRQRVPGPGSETRVTCKRQRTWRDKNSALWMDRHYPVFVPGCRGKGIRAKRCEAEKCVARKIFLPHIFLPSLGETGRTGTEVVRPDNGKMASKVNFLTAHNGPQGRGKRPRLRRLDQHRMFGQTNRQAAVLDVDWRHLGLCLPDPGNELGNVHGGRMPRYLRLDLRGSVWSWFWPIWSSQKATNTSRPPRSRPHSAAEAYNSTACPCNLLPADLGPVGGFEGPVVGLIQQLHLHRFAGPIGQIQVDGGPAIAGRWTHRSSAGPTACRSLWPPAPSRHVCRA